jgi:hypothetical protein
MDIQTENYNIMLDYIKGNKFVYQEAEEQNSKRIDVSHGGKRCCVKVYKTGTIQVQGKDCRLKQSLNQAKTSIENEENINDVLPFEIENFPNLLKTNIAEIDPVIIKFVEEAIITLKAGSNLGCAYLLGGASEKATYLLIDVYKNAIKNEQRRTKFESKTSKKFISRAFEEFKKSWKSSLNKPNDFAWSHDLETKIEQLFQFCRICRNEVGHPHLPPNLDKGVLIANMGQFVKYIQDLYKLIEYYNNNDVEF